MTWNTEINSLKVSFLHQDGFSWFFLYVHDISGLSACHLRVKQKPYFLRKVKSVAASVKALCALPGFNGALNN
jgi:hypothetical protein